MISISEGTDNGFTLIEIMIALAVISILAAFAIPSLLQSKMSANESTVVGSLRAIMNAQELYRTRTGRYGDCINLNDTHVGGSNTYLDMALVRADPNHPNHCNKAGYDIDISVNVNWSDWCCIATPAVWDKDGGRNFKLTSSGAIYYNMLNGNTTIFSRIVGSN